ncbi:MAG: DUF2138 family protein [Gallionella sp.]|nr:DUF2138 family protein [Gallionella sp.]
MRRIWIFVGLLAFTAASAAAYQRGIHWREFHFTGSRLKVDLAHPDALIRTTSLSQLPRDLLKVPIAHDVLTEDLAFYYEQNEDRLGLNGAIKRISYEHKLNWTDRILASVFNEPAEVALWRDDKGALRHYAIVMRRNSLSKVLQEAASVALQDTQLNRAGEIDIGNSKATVLALEINPRRTVLLISQGDRIVVLSDPGLLFDAGNTIVSSARAAVVEWLSKEGTLAQQFELDEVLQDNSTASNSSQPMHTFAIGVPTLALGYGAFLSGFKGLRFDFGGTWSTSAWIDQKGVSASGLGDSALWHNAPANPSACVLLPVDWRATKKVVAEVDTKPVQFDAFLALDGSALACWYSESTLYSPVFIARLSKSLPQRNAALQTLANWAITSGGDIVDAKGKNNKNDRMIWRSKDGKVTLGANGAYVAFSPDGTLVEKVLDTISRTNPSVADQMQTSSSTLALMMPRPLSKMTEREIFGALSGDDNLLAAAQTHLPARMQALATYPPYRLDLSSEVKSGWQRVEWRSPEKTK